MTSLVVWENGSLLTEPVLCCFRGAAVTPARVSAAHSPARMDGSSVRPRIIPNGLNVCMH